ncbi:MAG: DUF11 domain-containing protein [Anaerolineae bacterium]|nr:DUF11 domain-containing protein [Anaerolineae bacterium]
MAQAIVFLFVMLMGSPAIVTAAAGDVDAMVEAALTADSVPASLIPEESIVRPLYDGVAEVSLDVPDTVMLGADFTFTVTFTNAGSDPGYGPFIDVYLPTAGGDGDGDGIDVGSAPIATYLGQELNVTVLTFPASGVVSHPYAFDSSGYHADVEGEEGDKLVVIELPFGSFTPTQPDLEVTVKASLSDFANLGEDLVIRTRGGFRYGNTPLNDWCCGDITTYSEPDFDATTWDGSPVSPAVVDIEKDHDGLEGIETATGPNFERIWTVTVDIAEGQVAESLTIVDAIDNNIVVTSVGSFAYPDAATPPAGAPTVSVSGGGGFPFGPANAPDNEITISWGDDIEGGSGSEDITFEIVFYVPDQNADGDDIIDPTSGDDASAATNSLTSNDIEGEFDWTPTDPDDDPDTFTQNGVCVPPCEVEDKSIATQKSVSVVGGGDPVPDATLEWTIDFQVSDYFAFEDIVLTDYVSDGHIVDTGFTPTLSVTENGATISGDFLPAHFSYDNGTRDAQGRIELIFNVSDQLEDAGGAHSRSAQLLGGLVADGGGANDGATTGRVVFRTVIQQEFDVPSLYPGDENVNQGDEVSNTVAIAGNLLDTATCTPAPCTGTTGESEDDDSGETATVPGNEPSKVIYAHNGTALGTTVPPGAAFGITPGDTITYRIRYELLFGDFEDLKLTEYLPLPIFFAEDPDADGTGGHTWTQAADGTIPPVGQWAWGSNDEYHTVLSGASTPAVTTSEPENLIQWEFGDHEEDPNQGALIELLFTIQASNEPFADELYLSNMVQQSDNNTLAVTESSEAIAWVILTQPVLVSTKGVVAFQSESATSAPTYNPDPPALAQDGSTVTFSPSGTDGTPPSWSGGVFNNSNSVPYIDANITQVEGDDMVTFAIMIHNSGTSVNGAFDLRIRDELQTAQYEIPDPASAPPGNPTRFDNELNLQVSYGDTTNIPHDPDTTDGLSPLHWYGLGGGPDGIDNTADDIFGNGIEIVDDATGACQAHSVGPGKNLIIITYDLHIKPGVAPNTLITNESTLFNYAGEEGGPDHTSPSDQPLEGFSNEATARIASSGGKSATPGTVSVGSTYEVEFTVVIPPYTTAYEDPTTGTVSVRDFYNNENGVYPVPGSDQLVSSTNCSGTDLSSTSAFWTGHTINPFNPSPDTGTEIIWTFPGPIDNDTGGAACGFTVSVEVMVTNQDIFDSGYYWLPPTQTDMTSNDTATFQFIDETGADASFDLGSASVDIDQPYFVTTKAIPAIYESDGVTLRTVQRPRRGDFVLYSIGSTNNGESEAYEVVIEDALPEHIQYVTGSAFIDDNGNGTQDVGEVSITPTVTGDVTAGGQTVTFNIASVAAGDNAGPIVFRGEVLQSMPLGAVLDNYADVDWSTQPGTTADERVYDDRTELGDDSTDSGNDDWDTVAMTGIDLTIDKDFAPTVISQGDVSTLTFTLTNPNPETDLTNITFTDQLPVGLEINNPANITASGDCGGGTAVITAIPGTRDIIVAGLSIDDAEPDDTPRECQLTVDILGAVIGVYDNVTSNVNSTETGPGLTANAALIVADTLAVVKEFDPDQIYRYESTTLTFTMVNPNSAATYPGGLTGIEFIDILPAGLTIVSGPVDPVCGGALVAVPGTDEIHLTGGTLDPAPVPATATGGHVCEFDVVVTGDVEGVYNNTPAYLTSTETGVSTLYNTDTLTILKKGGGGRIGASAPASAIPPSLFVFDPGIVKLGDPAFAAIGETITWVITVRNPSSVPYPHAVISDTVDPQFSVESASSSKGTVNISGQTVTATIGLMNPGETVTISIVTRVISGPPGTAWNIAELLTDLGSAEIEGSVEIYPEELPGTGGKALNFLSRWYWVAGVGLLVYLAYRLMKGRRRKITI